jgi:hypothetical protein
LLKTNRDFWAGLVLSIGVVKPHILLLLALPLAFSRTRAFLGFCVGGLMAVLISLYLVGISGLTGLMEITRISATGTTFGVHHADMYSAVGLFARAGLSPYWVWAVFIIALVATSILWKKHPRSIHALCIGIVATVFAAPHLLMHDFAIIAIAIYLIHPFATIAASLLMLTLFGLGAPYLGGYLVMTLTALVHWNQLHEKPVIRLPPNRSSQYGQRKCYVRKLSNYRLVKPTGQFDDSQIQDTHWIWSMDYWTLFSPRQCSLMTGLAIGEKPLDRHGVQTILIAQTSRWRVC